MCVRNSAMSALRNSRVESLVTSPSLRNTSGEYWMYASGQVICRALQKLNTPRRLCCPIAVPIWPMEAPMSPAGRRGSTGRVNHCDQGRLVVFPAGSAFSRERRAAGCLQPEGDPQGLLDAHQLCGVEQSPA